MADERGVTFDGLRAVPKPQREPKRQTRTQMSGCGQRAKRTGGHAFPKLVHSGFRSWCRKQRCVATGVRTGEWVHPKPWMPPAMRKLCPYKAKVVVAHVKSRGAGGVDVGNAVPLEWFVHEWQGQIGWKEFEKKLGVMSAKEIAHEIGKAFVAAQSAIARNMEKAGR